MDSDDDSDVDEHFEKLIATRLLQHLDLETLNHCIVRCGCNPQRRRRPAAEEFARQLLQESDSEDSHPIAMC